MRNLSDYVAKEFAALGCPEVVTHELDGGKQHIKFANGAAIHVGPFASDAEILAAARKAFNMTEDNNQTAPEAPAPTSDKLPVIEVAPAPAIDTAPLKAVLSGGVSATRTTAPATPGDHASSIQDMMRGHVQAMNDIRDASIQTLRLSLERQLQALSAAPKKVAEKIDGQTEDFLALMGQFTNDLGI